MLQYIICVRYTFDIVITSVSSNDKGLYYTFSIESHPHSLEPCPVALKAEQNLPAIVKMTSL